MTPDLIALLEAGLRAKPPRGDEHLPHASDVVCDRQTWARRSGEAFMPLDFRTLMKFELGHQFERGVGDVLEAQLEAAGYAVARDVKMLYRGLTGHADFWCNETGFSDPSGGFVLEIKSTSFLRGKIPDEPASWYIEQTALYAAALDVPDFGILIGCRESGKLAPIFWFSLDDQRPGVPQTWREWAEARAEEIVYATNPDEPMPPPKPRTSWACKTCRWAGCELNPLYVADTASQLAESLGL